jgi:hypothetical protein
MANPCLKKEWKRFAITVRNFAQEEKEIVV